YGDQIAYADGRRTADLVRRAATGDQMAMAALRRIVPGDVKPAFAKGLLEALGPEALLRLPRGFTGQIKSALTDHPTADARAWDTRAVLALLRRSLALTTHPGRSGYIGDAYLKQIVQAGRTTFPPGLNQPWAVAGYQSLSTILGAADTSRFSVHFLRTVGGDMIAYDREVHRQYWAPPSDLTGSYGMGNALDAGTTRVEQKTRRTDFLIPLFNTAAASGRQGAQALLPARPTGYYTGDPSISQFKTSDLEYLLHDRRMAWAKTDHGAALGNLIKTATSGHDPESERIALHTIDLLAREARGTFSVDVKELKLTTGGKDGDDKQVDALSGLRPHVADMLATHIVKVNGLYGDFILGKDRTHAPVTDVDLDYVLLDLSRNADAFSTVLKAQIAHAKSEIDRAVASGDRLRLTNAIVANGQVFGHLLEARNQTILAEGGRVDAANKQLKDMVAMGLGLVVNAGAEVVGRKGGAPAEYAYQNTVQKMFEALAAQAIKPLEQKPNATLAKPTDNAEAIEALFGQMLVSSLVTTRNIDPKELKGKSFAEGDPPRIRGSLTPDQYSELLRWADSRFTIGDLQERAAGAADRGMDQVSGHYRTRDGEFNVRRSGQR
ncbi:DUF6571 family protein, partial [Actinomadura adrarensis]